MSNSAAEMSFVVGGMQQQRTHARFQGNKGSESLFITLSSTNRNSLRRLTVNKQQFLLAAALRLRNYL